MFRIITQDGRTLALLSGYKVSFEAGQYTGGITCGVVEATIKRRGKASRFSVILGEYPDYDTARHACDALENAYRMPSRKRPDHFTMAGNRGFAKDDDLMAAIAEMDRRAEQNGAIGWTATFGMINGKTTNVPVYDIVPDSEGSYLNNRRQNSAVERRLSA